MMRLYTLICLLLLPIAPPTGAGEFNVTRPIPEVRLKDGKTLKNVLLISYAESAAMARWDGGRGTIAYGNMPDDLVKAIGERRPTPPAPPAAANPPAEAKPAEPEPPAEMKPGKLALGNIDMRAIDSSGSYVTYAWKAEVMNGTDEPQKVDAEIKLFDKDGFELDHDYADTIYVPAGKRGTATGKGMVKDAIWDAAKSFQVKLRK